MNAQHLLLICLNFPPNTGIGGKRWTKYAHALALLGYTIHVIHAKPLYKESVKNPWHKQSIHPNIIHYPIGLSIWIRLLIHPSKNIFYKILKKFAMWVLQKKESGTIYDTAIGLEKQLNLTINKIDKTYKIQTSIVTCAPFNLAYYIAKRKQQKGSNKALIIDYRDPWLEAQNYGMPHLSAKQKNREIHKQNTVLEYANVILAPNEFMLKTIEKEYSGQKKLTTKFICLEHGFDAIPPKEKTKITPQKPLHFIYAGSVYMGLEAHLQTLNSWITKHKKHLENTLCFSFYTDQKTKLDTLFKGHESIVKTYAPIGEKINEKISGADGILLMYAKHNKNFLTSKFYESLPLKKAYVYIGEKGYALAFIERFNIGFSLKEEHLKSTDILLKDLNKRDVAFDYQKYSYQKLAEQKLIPLLS